jgi:hypothetical protein
MTTFAEIGVSFRTHDWASSDIHLPSDGIEVVWIDARSDTTKVIEIEPVRNDTDKHFIRNAMRLL